MARGTSSGRKELIRSVGIYSNPNPLAAADESFATLDNAVLDHPALPSKRRGFGRQTQFLPAGAPGHPSILALQAFGSLGTVGYGVNGSTKQLSYYSAGWNSIDTTLAQNAIAVNGLPMPMVQAQGNMYLLANQGVYALDGTGSLRKSGGPKGIGFDQANTSPAVWDGTAGNPKTIPDGNQAAYRYTLLLRDNNNNVIEGPPSGRYVVSNTSGSNQCPQMRMVLPAEATTSNWLRLYRSTIVQNGYNAANSPAVTPNEDLQLVFESPLFSVSDISNGYYQVADVTPDNLRGAFIYTSPNFADGIAATNDQPPAGADGALYKDIFFIGNIRGKQRLTITLLGVQTGGAGPGIATGDTITIAGVTYTLGGTQDPTTNKVLIQSGSSAAINIEQTARNLVTCINQSAQSGATVSIYATYASGPDDLPGMLQLEARTPNGAAYTAQASAHGTAWQPNLASAQSSVAAVQKNGMAYSKAKQPEAFPPGNVLLFGTQDTAIVRVLPMRDGLLVFKDGDGGLWKLTGDNPGNFRVSQLDPTVRIVFPNSAQILGSMAYCVTKNGVQRGNLARWEPIDQPINDLILSSVVPLSSGPFAVAYESDRRYILFDGFSANQTTCHVFNEKTEQWSTFTIPMKVQAGCIAATGGGPGNQLVIGDDGNVNGAYSFTERKNYLPSDFSDDTASGANQAITTTMGWRIIVGDDPAAVKQFREVVFIFNGTPTAITVTFSTEDNTSSPVTLNPANGKQRCLVPLECQRAATLSVKLTHSTANEDIQVEMMAVIWNAYSQKIAR